MSATDPAGVLPDSSPSAPEDGARRSRHIAIGLMCMAVFLFALLDVVAKHLVTGYDPIQIAWSRYVFHVLIALVLTNPFVMPGVWRTRRPLLQFFRSVLLALTTILNFWALETLRLDETVSIMFATPFLVAILAGPLLGEWVGPRRMIAIMVGFSGVLLVTQPGVGEWKPAYLLSFGNAVFYSIYNVLTRMVGAHDNAWTSFFYVPMFGGLLLAPALPAVWVWPDNAFDWGLLASTGALGGFGHLMLIIAHVRAPAGVLAPFMYTQIIWMITLGWVVFQDRPDIWTLSGAGIVIASGLYLFARERTVKAAHGAKGVQP